MKITGLFIAACILTFTSCSSSKDLASSKEIKKVIVSEKVQKAIETQQYVIKLDKFYPRRGRYIDLNPSRNYIVLNYNQARISLGYSGRSNSIAQNISGINMSGEVISNEISVMRKGGYSIKMKVRQNNDTFTLHMTIGKDGYANVRVTHPRIDNVSYYGRLSVH